MGAQMGGKSPQGASFITRSADVVTRRAAEETERELTLAPAPVDEPSEVAAADAPASRPAKKAAPKGAGRKTRKNFHFNTELTERIDEVAAAWKYSDQERFRAFHKLDETPFVAALLSYALDQLDDSIKKGGGPHSLHNRFHEYLPEDRRSK